MITAILLGFNYCAVGVFSLVRKKGHPFNLLDPAWAFLAGYFINYCFRPTLFLLYPEVGLWYEKDLQPAGTFAAALPGVLVFALFGFLGFIIGDLYCGRFALRFSRHLPDPDLRRCARYSPYAAIATLFLAAGVAGLWGFIRQTGWSGTLFALLTGFQRGAFLDVIQGHGYYLFAMQLSAVGWALLCARWIAYPKVRRGWRRLRAGLGARVG